MTVLIVFTGLGEAMLLAALDHDNIVKLLDVLELPEDRGTMLVLTHCGVSSANWNPSRSTDVIRFFTQLFSALKKCHQTKVMHNDVKPSNVVVENEHVVLIDFGLSIWTLYCEVFSSGSGGATLHYSAPETLQDKARLGFEVDCWSCGVMLAEQLLGAPLWTATSPDALREEHAKFFSRFSREWFEVQMPNPSLLSDAMWRVLRGCLTEIPAHRMSSEDALRTLQEVDAEYQDKAPDMKKGDTGLGADQPTEQTDSEDWTVVPKSDTEPSTELSQETEAIGWCVIV